MSQTRKKYQVNKVKKGGGERSCNKDRSRSLEKVPLIKSGMDIHVGGNPGRLLTEVVIEQTLKMKDNLPVRSRARRGKRVEE